MVLEPGEDLAVGVEERENLGGLFDSAHSAFGADSPLGAGVAGQVGVPLTSVSLGPNEPVCAGQRSTGQRYR